MFLVTKRTLLFTAAAVWTFAAIMLISRGLNGIIESRSQFLLKFGIALIVAAAFYILLFKKISNKHVIRIKQLKSDKVPFYSFFNLKSYIMMGLMITMGITIRKTGIIDFEYLAVFYVSMGTPLAVSAIKFIYNAINYK